MHCWTFYQLDKSLDLHGKKDKESQLIKKKVSIKLAYWQDCVVFLLLNQCGRAQPAVGSANIGVLSCVRKQIEKATGNIPPQPLLQFQFLLCLSLMRDHGVEV